MPQYRGYASTDYARAFADAGVTRVLPQSGAILLERSIEGTSARDAMGLYPLFSCPRWAVLGDDLASLEGSLVTVVCVVDPLRPPPSEDIARSCFPHLCSRWKDHIVLRNPGAWQASASAHHRRYARSARRSLTVEPSVVDDVLVREWQSLYAELIVRHDIRGIPNFSRDSLRAQLETPGTLVVTARDDHGTAVAIALFMVDGADAWYHLGASSVAGYAARASFGIFGEAFEELGRRGVERVDLGAAAGISPTAAGGLLAFKTGWSEARLPTWLCGRVLDRSTYVRLCDTRADSGTYFPAYRAPR